MGDSSAAGMLQGLLRRWEEGDKGRRWKSLTPFSGRRRLRRLAAHYLRIERVWAAHAAADGSRPRGLLCAWSIRRHVVWQNRAHFFGIAAQMMRRVPWITPAAGLPGSGIAATYRIAPEGADPEPRRTANWRSWPCTTPRRAERLDARRRRGSSRCSFFGGPFGRGRPKRPASRRPRSNANGERPGPGCAGSSIPLGARARELDRLKQT